MDMNGVCLVNITRIRKDGHAPRLVFSNNCLSQTGFTAGALVQYLPENGGMSFALCNENIPSYSDLYHATKAKGGVLMQVYCNPRDGLQLTVSGSVLDPTELQYGDALIARYEYGFIRLRKLPTLPTLPKGSVKLVTAHVIGQWLVESGFMPDAVLTVAAQPGTITCTLQENGIGKAAELVKYARANKLKLLQVQYAKYNRSSTVVWIDLPQSCLDSAGFAPDDALLATYKHGFIQLQKPDFVGLGF